jgi:hypothetical protein
MSFLSKAFKKVTKPISKVVKAVEKPVEKLVKKVTIPVAKTVFKPLDFSLSKGGLQLSGSAKKLLGKKLAPYGNLAANLGGIAVTGGVLATLGKSAVPGGEMLPGGQVGFFDDFGNVGDTLGQLGGFFNQIEHLGGGGGTSNPTVAQPVQSTVSAGKIPTAVWIGGGVIVGLILFKVLK